MRRSKCQGRSRARSSRCFSPVVIDARHFSFAPTTITVASRANLPFIGVSSNAGDLARHVLYPPFNLRVLHVVLLRADKQVRRIHAAPYVAAVQYQKPTRNLSSV